MLTAVVKRLNAIMHFLIVNLDYPPAVNHIVVQAEIIAGETEAPSSLSVRHQWPDYEAGVWRISHGTVSLTVRQVGERILSEYSGLSEFVEKQTVTEHLLGSELGQEDVFEEIPRCCNDWKGSRNLVPRGAESKHISRKSLNQPPQNLHVMNSRDYPSIVHRGPLNSPSFALDAVKNLKGDDTALFRSLRRRERARLLSLGNPEESRIVSPPPEDRPPRVNTREKNRKSLSNGRTRSLVSTTLEANWHPQRSRRPALVDITKRKIHVSALCDRKGGCALKNHKSSEAGDETAVKKDSDAGW